MSLPESIIEEAALDWFGALGYEVGHGPHLAPGELSAVQDCGGNIERRMEEEGRPQ